MRDIGDKHNFNSNDEDEGNESTDNHDEENSAMERTQPIVTGPTHSPQPATDLVPNDTDHITNQLIVRESDSDASSRYSIIPSRYCDIDISFFWYWLMSILMGLSIGHSLYWFILVLICLGIYCIHAFQYPIWTYDNRFRLQLGHTRPWPLEYTLGLNQGGQGADHVAQPSDALQPVVITFIFSKTITQYFPPPRESTAIENVEPHSMPIPIALNSVGQDHTVNNENSHPNNNETARSDLHEMASPPVHIELNIQAIVVGNAATGVPTEILQDTDFPDITNEHQNNNELDTSSDDEQRLVPDSFLYVDSDDDDNDVINNSDHRVETLPNTETIIDIGENNTPSIQTNATDEQSIATPSTIDSLFPRIRESGRCVDAPTEGDPARILPDMNSMINNTQKVPTPSNSSEESSEETDV